MAMVATAAADQPPPPKPATPLRRAAYVNVDKLVRSQYDIDLQRLTDELARLKARASEPPSREQAHENAVDGGDGKGSGGGDLPVSEEVGPPSAGAAAVKPNVWSGTNLSVLPGGPFRSPLPHAKYHHQSRLQPPRDGFNLCLLVGKVELVVDKYRVDGSRVLVAEVEVGDETGSISLRARDEQIDLLRQVSNDGGAIVLRNCTMELYQGKHLRLAVSKWGKMSVYPDGIESTPPPPSMLNQELNFSLVDLNIVAMTKMPSEPAFPVPVATVHHKTQKQPQHPQKHFDDSPSRGGNPRNRARLQQQGGGGYYSHQKKKKDDWQHHRQHPHRPRSGSHNMSPATGNQYLLQHQQSGGSASPPAFFPQMQYQQYSDANSVYSYPPPQGDQPASPHPPHRQFLPNDHYTRQRHILYQQYELQQRHAHQMQALQQQQESQRKWLQQQQQQAHSSLIPDLNRVGSQESGGDYPSQGMGPPSSLQLGPGSFPPTPPNMQQMALSPAQHPGMSSDYPYGSLVPPPPMGNVFQGEQGQQPRGNMGGPSYATIISPPMSPAHGSHPAPQAPPQYPDGRIDNHLNPENKE